ncbi:MAG: hypothetical protein QM500_07855 [Methylococcales bacterium]
MSNSKQDILEVLNIADSFTLAMDEEIRQDGLAGSLCGFALELNQTPDIKLLQQRIEKFSHQFPVALSSLQQRGKRFYWCKREKVPALFFQHTCSENQDDQLFQKETIKQLINNKQNREEVLPIEFHLINSSSQSCFFIRWVHPFCDARGIDLILKYLSAEETSPFEQEAGKPLVNQQLDKYSWWKKFTLLIKGKRYIQSIDKLTSIQPFKCEQAPEQLNYSIFKLTPAQTDQVSKLARKKVGLTGTSLYYIACLMRALDKMNPEHSGDAYCSPYAFNLRKQRALTPVIANHVCALFAQASREIIQDRDKLFTHLKQQNMQIIRQQLDYAFLPLMWAGSWLSLAEYGKILRQSSQRKERSSFWFSDVGKLDIPSHSFPGAEITSIFHLCQVTTPPGLAFLCCIYQNQLTLSYNFVEPLASLVQIEKLHQLVLAELLEET